MGNPLKDEKPIYQKNSLSERGVTCVYHVTDIYMNVDISDMITDIYIHNLPYNARRIVEYYNF